MEKERENLIRVENLSFGFRAKDLYKDVSFKLEAGQHCALIGSNGTGKSTLVEILTDPEEYLYDGKIIVDENCRIRVCQSVQRTRQAE